MNVNTGFCPWSGLAIVATTAVCCSRRPAPRLVRSSAAVFPAHTNLHRSASPVRNRHDHVPDLTLPASATACHHACHIHASSDNPGRHCLDPLVAMSSARYPSSRSIRDGCDAGHSATGNGSCGTGEFGTTPVRFLIHSASLAHTSLDPLPPLCSHRFSAAAHRNAPYKRSWQFLRECCTVARMWRLRHIET